MSVDVNDVMDGSRAAPVSSLSAPEIASAVTGVVNLLREAGAVAGRFTGRELTELAQGVLAALQTAEAAAVEVTREALEQGVIADSTAAGGRDWIRRLSAGEPIADVVGAGAGRGAGPLVDHRGVEDDVDTPGAASRWGDLPGMEPAHAGRIAAVAEATRPRRNHHLRAALADGAMSVACAKAALHETSRTQPALKGSTPDQVLGYYVEYARELPGPAVVKDVKALSARILAEYSEAGELDRTEDAAQKREWLDLRTTLDGMVRVEGQLSPDHGAMLRHAITALSGPSPESSCCDDPHHRHRDGAEELGPDLRGPSERRADAFVALMAKAAELVDADGAICTSGTARMAVTMNHDLLIEALSRTGSEPVRPVGLHPSDGSRGRGDPSRRRDDPPDVHRLSGSSDSRSTSWLGRRRGPTPGGVTDADDPISPAFTRALACDAEIIPMVLGAESEPLDVGRARRLVPPGLRRAVIARDHHCTFPGCDRLPSWCQVHHVVPWQVGGETSLGNSALLCQRHHTVVHRDGYSATVDGRGVVWDLTRPGVLHQ